MTVKIIMVMKRIRNYYFTQQLLFFLVLIFFLWILNLPSILNSNTIEEEETDNFNWGEITKTLKKTWSGFTDNWDEVNLDLENEVEKIQIYLLVVVLVLKRFLLVL